MKPKLDLTDPSTLQIAGAVLDMLESGKTVHEIQPLVNKIVEEVWFGFINDKREAH